MERSNGSSLANVHDDDYAYVNVSRASNLDARDPRPLQPLSHG